MNKERFKLDEHGLWDIRNNAPPIWINSHTINDEVRIDKDGLNRLVDWLNDLDNEKELLQKKYISLQKEFHESQNEWVDSIEKLYQDNRKLETFKLNIFDLINNKIKELQDINEVSIIPRESIKVLQDLKEELKSYGEK